MDLHAPLTRRLLLGLTPLALVGGPVVAVCMWFNSLEVGAFACLAILAAAFIAVAGEVAASALANESPLLKLLIGMGFRGMCAAFLILLAIVTSGHEPRTIVCIALPLYLSLIVGEVWLALRTQPSEPSAVCNRIRPGGVDRLRGDINQGAS